MTQLNRSAPRYLEALAAKAGEIIRGAEAAGLTIDDGNVVDLIADNTDARLDEIRVALGWLYPNGERFAKAVAYQAVQS